MRKHAKVLGTALSLMAGAAAAQAVSMELFQLMDWNRDGKLTAEEARGSVPLIARFNDIDTDRDGVILPEDLQRYLRETTPKELQRPPAKEQSAGGEKILPGVQQ
jgi:hypothetical protein